MHQRHRKPGRGQPEEINQSKVDFMPGGFRTNQAHIFYFQKVSVLPFALKRLATLASFAETGRLGEGREGAGRRLSPDAISCLNFGPGESVTYLKH